MGSHNLFSFLPRQTDALEIRDPNPPNTTNTQIKNIKNANTNSSHQKSILQLIPARNLLPSLLPRLQLVKLKYSIEDPHPTGNISRPKKKNPVVSCTEN